MLARAGSESELVFSKPRPKGMARLPVSWMLLFNPKQPRCELRSLQCERENRPVSSSVDLSYLNPCLLVQCASRKLCRGKGPQSSNNNDKSGGPTARLSLGRPCCLHDPSCNCALLVHEAARPEARSRRRRSRVRRRRRVSARAKAGERRDFWVPSGLAGFRAFGV